MRYFSYYLLLAIWTCIITACNRPKAVSEISGRLRNIRIESPSDRKAINWDGLIDEIQVIPLESDSDYLISAIDKLIVKEKFIYILDQGQQKIFIYYKDGKFFRK